MNTKSSQSRPPRDACAPPTPLSLCSQLRQGLRLNKQMQAFGKIFCEHSHTNLESMLATSTWFLGTMSTIPILANKCMHHLIQGNCTSVHRPAKTGESVHFVILMRAPRELVPVAPCLVLYLCPMHMVWCRMCLCVRQ
jgi:hypothetical protein